METKVENSSTNCFIYWVALLSAIGGFLFGYDTGIVSGAMVFIKDDFKLDETWQELIVSITVLGAWIFSLVSGYLTDRFGRKTVVLLGSFVFTVGGIIMAIAPEKWTLFVGR